MIKKLLKKLTIASVCISMVIINPVNSFAAEISTEENITMIENEDKNSEISTYGYNSMTVEFNHKNASVVTMMNMGFNPTVKVTARGNSNMIYKIWVVNPVGITGDIGYIRADGSTISKNLWMSIGGDYYVYIQPWEGSTSINSAYFDFNITW